VLCTAPSEDAAGEIARALVERRLAACVNIIPTVRSIYRWQDQIEEEREALLVIKTHTHSLDELYLALPELHPYEVPEGIGWHITSGLPAYLTWVSEETSS